MIFRLHSFSVTNKVVILNKISITIVVNKVERLQTENLNCLNFKKKSINKDFGD